MIEWICHVFIYIYTYLKTYAHKSICVQRFYFDGDDREVMCRHAKEYVYIGMASRFS